MTIFPTFKYFQDLYRFRNDNGSETTATFKAAANTNTGNEVTDANIRMRFSISASGGSATLLPQFQYNKNVAGWNNITTNSSVIQAASSVNFSNNTATTQQLADGADIFVAGQMNTTGLAGSGANIGDGTYTEYELCFIIKGGDVVIGDTIQIRVTDNGTALDTYTQTPTITVTRPGAYDSLPLMGV